MTHSWVVTQEVLYTVADPRPKCLRLEDKCGLLTLPREPRAEEHSSTKRRHLEGEVGFPGINVRVGLVVRLSLDSQIFSQEGG